MNLKKTRSIDLLICVIWRLTSRLDRSYNFIINQMRYSILIATALVVWWEDRKQYVFEKFAWSCTLLNLLPQPHNGSSCHTMCLISYSFVEKIPRGQLFWHVPSMLSFVKPSLPSPLHTHTSQLRVGKWIVSLVIGRATDYRHPDIPNFWAWAEKLGYLGLGFEFGTQIIRNLAIVSVVHR